MKFDTMDELEDYAEFAHSSLIYLLLEALNVQEQLAFDVASHIGVCIGITTLLRGHFHHASQVQYFYFDQPGFDLTILLAK